MQLMIHRPRPWKLALCPFCKNEPPENTIYETPGWYVVINMKRRGEGDPQFGLFNMTPEYWFDHYTIECGYCGGTGPDGWTFKEALRLWNDWVLQTKLQKELTSEETLELLYPEGDRCHLECYQWWLDSEDC